MCISTDLVANYGPIRIALVCIVESVRERCLAFILRWVWVRDQRRPRATRDVDRGDLNVLHALLRVPYRCSVYDMSGCTLTNTQAQQRGNGFCVEDVACIDESSRGAVWQGLECFGGFVCRNKNAGSVDIEVFLEDSEIGSQLQGCICRNSACSCRYCASVVVHIRVLTFNSTIVDDHGGSPNLLGDRRERLGDGFGLR